MRKQAGTFLIAWKTIACKIVWNTRRNLLNSLATLPAMLACCWQLLTQSLHVWLPW